MGFTSNETSDTTSGHEQGHGGPNFGQRLGTYLEGRNPIAGELIHQVFGGGQSTQAQPIQQETVPLPNQDAQLMEGTRPLKTRTGLSTILKLLAGGG